MPLIITHAKANTITDWTQAQLDSIIAGNPAPLPPVGTVLNDVVLPSDWNDVHQLTGSVEWGEITGTITDQTDLVNYIASVTGDYVLKAGDTMTGQLIIDNPGGDGLSVDGDALFSNDFDIDINGGEAVTFNYGQTSGGNTATPFSIYDSRTSTGTGLAGTTLIISGISSARGVYKGIDQTLIIDNTGATSSGYGHLLEIAQGTTEAKGFGHASFIPGSTIGAAIYGSTNRDKATFLADVAAGTFVGKWAGNFDGLLGLNTLTDDATQDIDLINFGTSNLSVWWSGVGSGTGWDALWLDTGFGDEAGINVYAASFNAVGDITAGNGVSGNVYVSAPTGNFTDVYASTVQGAPNLIVTAIATNARTARFGAYSSTAGIPSFSAGLTSTSSTGAATHDLNTACTIGSAYIYRVGGTDVTMADGGSGASLTASAGGIVWSDADSMEVLAGTNTAGRMLRSGNLATPSWSTAVFPADCAQGDLIYASTISNYINLTGNISLTKMFLTQTGTGSAANAPAWGLIAGTDISVSYVDGTVLWAESGTIAGDPDDYNFTYEVSDGVLHMAKTNLTGYINFQEVTELDTSTIPLIRFGDDQNLSYGGFPATLTWQPPSKFVPGGQLQLVDTGGTVFFNFKAGSYYGTWAGDDINLTSQVTGTLPVANGGTGATTLTGTLIGNGTSAFTAATSSTVGQVLRCTGANTFAYGAVDLADTDAVTGDLPFSNLTQGSARSVLGVTGNATADFASIQGTANQVLVINSAGTALAFGQVNLASSSAITGDLPFANLTQIAGLSLLGVAGNSTADVAAITAASDGQVMRRNGTAIGFGTVALDSANAVSGTLPVTRGGTGAGSFGTGGVLFGNGTGAILSDSLFLWDTTNNLLGVGAAPPTTNPGRVYIQTSGFNLRLSSSETNVTTKTSATVGTHYTTAEEPMGIIYSYSDASSSIIRWGGGISAVNTTTSQEWFTAANNTTVTGTRVFHINSSQNMLIGVASATGAGNCRLNVEKTGSAYTYTNGGVAVGRSVDDTGSGAAFIYMGFNNSTGIGFIDTVDLSAGYASTCIAANGGALIVGNPTLASGGKLDVIASSSAAIAQMWKAAASGDDMSTRLYPFKVTTTNATVTSLATIGTTTNSTETVKIYVTAIRSGGIAGAAGDRATYEGCVNIGNVAGTVTVNGGAGAVAITAIYESQAAWAVDVIQSGTTYLIRVTGAANNNVSWYARVMREGPYTTSG